MLVRALSRKDHYYVWAKIIQEGQFQSQTTVHTAVGHFSLGVYADEFIRDNFLFGIL